MTALTESVELEYNAATALLIIDNPPVNALSYHVREGILKGIKAAEESEATAIVLICNGRTFIAGADITEFGAAPKPPTMVETQDAIENCSKPVIAAIHGTALGGGLEVALCAHYRVAIESAQLGLPEVKLGLLPGAGGTQRLPRITGLRQALEMITTGDPISAKDAFECGLVDAIVQDLKGDTIEFAQNAVSQNLPLRRIRDRDVTLSNNEQAIFDEYRQVTERKARGFLAPKMIIQCVEAAAALEFDVGLARESELFLEVMRGPQSTAQQYAFFAERAANKVPEIPRDIARVEVSTGGVLGAGTMGTGIAMNFANAGIPVTIVERNQRSLDQGMQTIRQNYERSISRGRLAHEDFEKRISLITGSLDMADFKDSDIVIEAVFEDIHLKKAVFADLDAICSPHAVLASNTSALNLDDIAAATARPQSVIGMHFFSPANVMRLVEVVRGRETSKAVVATAMALSKRLKKVAVLVGVCDGFVGNRMLFQRNIETESLLLEGTTPARIDDVLYDFGFPMGPCAMMDLAGLDIGWNAAESNGETIRDLLCAAGRRGRKNGRGYYTYDPDTWNRNPDSEVEEIIATLATQNGVPQRKVSDQEILDRCLYPMINEAAKILEEQIAIRASDIDVIWVNGYGWPVYTGGPMFWADSLGLSNIVDSITKYSQTTGGDHWSPSPLLQKLAAEGEKLQSYAGVST